MEFQLRIQAMIQSVLLNAQIRIKIAQSGHAGCIQFNDKETGTIICKGIFKCENHVSKFVVDFILQIDSKDSKVRIKIYQQRLSINSQDIGSLEEIFTKHKHSWLVKRDYIQLNKEIKVHNIGLMIDYYESISNSKKDEW